MDWDAAFNKAFAWCQDKYPDASEYHRHAFANSVAYLVTGASSGSGPSIREHCVSMALAGDGENVGLFQFPDGRVARAGEWKFERACEFAEPICFGPLPQMAHRFWAEQCQICFDDDPADLALLEGK